MSLLTDRAGTALLVIDVQVDVVSDAHERDSIVANIRTLTEQARAAGVPIVWVQHSDEWMSIDSESWQLVPELERQPGEPLVHKQFRSSFESTELDDVLADLGAAELVIAGAQTNNCIRHTIHAALERGYDVILAEDAHTTSDFEWDHGTVRAATIIDEQNASLQQYSLPGRSCSISPAASLFTNDDPTS
jgi:nicotinamidase-related amidase